MPTPTLRFWKKKVVLFKPEVTYGTDPVPTGAANYIEARNVSLSAAEFDAEDRGMVKENMGNTSKLITGKRVKLSFDIALAASGTLGVAPKLGPLLLACGFAETVTVDTKVEYTLVSSAFSSGTFYINIDGTLHKGKGARGTATLRLDKGIPVLRVELTALYTAPTDTALPGATRTGWPTEYPVNKENTLVVTVNAVDSWYSKCEVNLGNQIVHDDFPGGYEAIVQKDRAPTASMSILAPTLATLDPFALMAAQTNIAVQVVHGPSAGNKVQVDMKAQITSANYEDIQGNVGYALGLTLEDPTDLNTELKLTFV